MGLNGQRLAVGLGLAALLALAAGDSRAEAAVAPPAAVAPATVPAVPAGASAAPAAKLPPAPAPPAPPPARTLAEMLAALPRLETPAPELAQRVTALVEQLKAEGQRKDARKAIIEIGDVATPVLVTRMTDPDFTIRWEMANVQGDIRDPRAIPFLVQNVLKDADAHIRWRSLWALNEYSDDALTLALLREGMTATDDGTRWNAAVGLSMFNAPECLPVIHAGVTSPDKWRRWEATNALSRLHDESSARALAPMLASRDARERNEAVLSLSKIGGPEAVDLLITALSDPSSEVRWRAAMGLGSLKDPKAQAPLQALLATEKDPTVLQHATKALGALPRPSGVTSVVDGTVPSQAHAPRARQAVIIGGALIVLLTIVAYLPAMRGGFIWDDDQYVTGNATLRDADGLRRIWFEMGAVPQYYPLVHTTYWVEHHLWGNQPLGYHVTNVLLHAAAALLLGCVLRRLQVPGAWLAAAIFALHPVQAESVAWITERKNVLSALFYFAAALAWLRFAPPDEAIARGRRRWWLLALALFVAALLSKTVTCSLPAALLLVAWWKKGRLRRGDVLPVLPFFAVGAGLGLMTAWMEKHNVGAQGAEWSLTFADRCLIAGRALWFYAGKLAWPVDLTFIYPRWHVDAGTWWQWLFPLAAVAVVAALFLARRRIGRGPVVATLLFAGTLAPALGFIDVYPMRYSFVADHFQYLGCVGLVALAAALLARLPRPAWGALALVLCALTWRQARIYRDIETLWRDTIAKNPDCWMAHNNLGAVLADDGKLDEAIEHYRSSLAINPDNAEAHNNWGLALVKQGRVDEAIAHHRRAIELSPDNIMVRIDSGVALEAKGLMEEAVETYRAALALNPTSAEAHYNLGNALMAEGRAEEAVASYREALRVKPGYAEAHVNLGNALANRGQLEEAIEHYRASLRIRPMSAKARNNLGSALMRTGKFDEANEQCAEAVRLMPDYAGAYANLGDALAARGRGEDAVSVYEKALRLNPADLRTHLNLARVLAHLGRREEAIARLTEVLQHVPGEEDARQQLRDLGVAPPP